MKVELLTPKSFFQFMVDSAVKSAQICYANEGKEVNSKEFLSRIIKHNHGTILEHIFLKFRISGISRALLQELARHRLATLSVESTRHTLKKYFANDNALEILKSVDTDLLLGDYAKDDYIIATMGQIIGRIAGLLEICPDIPNDVLKYFLPEFWPTKLDLSLNIRELRHIIDLRTSPRALKEFQVLAHELFNAVPDEFKYLLKDCVHEEAQS